jgi:hypothetical protein
LLSSFFHGEGNDGYQLGIGFFVRKRIISAIRGEEFSNGRLSYVIVRGFLCNIIIMNVHSPCEDKSDDVADSFCEELGYVFHQFPSYDMKILLGDFSVKVGREDIFKPTFGNESS